MALVRFDDTKESFVSTNFGGSNGLPQIIHHLDRVYRFKEVRPENRYVGDDTLVYIYSVTTEESDGEDVQKQK